MCPYCNNHIFIPVSVISLPQFPLSHYMCLLTSNNGPYILSVPRIRITVNIIDLKVTWGNSRELNAPWILFPLTVSRVQGFYSGLFLVGLCNACCYPVFRLLREPAVCEWLLHVPRLHFPLHVHQRLYRQHVQRPTRWAHAHTHTLTEIESILFFRLLDSVSDICTKLPWSYKMDSILMKSC